MKEEVQVTVNLTEEDLKVYYVFLFVEKIVKRPTQTLLRIISSILISIGIIYSLPDEMRIFLKSFRFVYDLFFLFLPILFFIFSLFISFWFIKHGLKSSFQSNGFYKNKHFYSFNSKEIFLKSSSVEVKFLWNYVSALLENKRFFLLLISDEQTLMIPQRYCILPKRCFSSKEDIELVKKFFKENIEAKKLKLLKEMP